MLHANIQQIFILRILSNDFDVIVSGQAIDDLFPRFAIIRCHESMRCEVIAAVMIDRHEGRARMVFRCMNFGDP